MKKIELNGPPEIPLNKIWWGSSIFAILLVLDFLVMGKFDLLAVLPIAVWIIIVLRAPNTIENPLNTGYRLEFRDADMICMKGDAIFWHVPFTKISYVSDVGTGWGRWINRNYNQILINTQDGDSFLVPVRLAKQQYLEITAEVERVKTPYQG